MIHSSRITVILDANVLYPAPLRDYLLHLANIELYKPKWTDQIHEEWIRNLLSNREDLKREDLERTKNTMNSAFPDANITNYERIVRGLSLPDNNDRHILAAAIRGNANVIVTFNLKDFPYDNLKWYDIEAQHPDGFITNLINLDKSKSLQALHNLVKSLRNPPKSLKEVLQTLEICGLPNSVSNLKN
ncbi:MAG: PIN domain-containing protein [Chitinophagaceae bacterium]